MNNHRNSMSAVAKTPPFANPKVNKAIPKVNRAKAQSRVSGILSAQADGKLYFERLTSFRAAQNHLPHKGEVRYSEVMRPGIKLKIENGKLKIFVATSLYIKFFKIFEILKP